MNFREIANLGDDFYFSVSHASSGTELWKSDGTVDGTQLVKRVGPAHSQSFFPSAASMGELLLFAANDGVHGTELWSSDGTEAGTLLVKDVWPGKFSPSEPWSSTPKELVNVNGAAYFVASHDFGKELWKTDGTSEGTQPVDAISTGGYPTPYLANVDGVLYFSSLPDSGGWKLWKNDGTEAGTTLIKDVDERSYLYPNLFRGIDGVSLFFANDGVHGRELWPHRWH